MMRLPTQIKREKHIMRLIVRLALFIAVLSLFSVGVFAQDSKAPSCKIYNIKIKGYVAGSYFERNGRIGVYKPGLSASNAEELWLVSGDPVSNAAKGAIRFTTNSFFAKSSSYSDEKYDMAFVAIYNGPKTISITPSLQMSNLTLGNVNYYTTTGNVSSLREINKGKIEVEFKSGGKVSGWAQIHDQYQSGGYNVTFTGNLFSTSSSSNCQFNNN
jgi:hypothetical protein